MRVAIIGGGYAGMAAAMELAAAGRQVEVFEAGPVLGGRARRVEVEGLVLDNGQHMAIGAYSELLRLLNMAGMAENEAFVRVPMELDVFEGPRRAMRLACPRLPAPFHTMAGLFRAEGLSWGARLAAARLMTKAKLTNWKLAQDQSVAAWLAANRQPEILVRCLWEPLTLAALNTPIATASAQVLLNVLRDSLAAERAASDFLLPKTDLSAAFPEAAARYLRQLGGKVHTSSMVKQLQRTEIGWQLDRSTVPFDQLIIALPPHRLYMLANGIPTLAAPINLLANWQWQPIYTAYLRYPTGTRLPKPMLGMAGSTTQWLFDRGQLCGQDGLMAAVISAEGPHESWSQDVLATTIAREIQRCLPHLPPPLWHRVIAEKRATFACLPQLQRPGNATSDPTLWLAGDYTAGDYPATLEGAIRSGIAAARGVLA
ncbi:hydroxysqualene dehydroxylase HpnE [Chitinimonas sp. PSY-7]|uniref:hydroxysqualene dehydroxylase HpnE n=1 Tax=Chitinimonas sp. PSY-7 TaxID=3459088 RepID=UPI0040402D5E